MTGQPGNVVGSGDTGADAQARRGEGGPEPVKLRIELGRQWLSADKVAGLSPGSVIELRSTARDEVDVYAGGRLAARGELVVIEGQLGVRLTSLTPGKAL
jgi:flagellar motor switch protein FliM